MYFKLSALLLGFCEEEKRESKAVAGWLQYGWQGFKIANQNNNVVSMTKVELENKITCAILMVAAKCNTNYIVTKRSIFFTFMRQEPFRGDRG